MKRISLCLPLLLAPGPAPADAPLSAIEWLKEPPPVSVAQPLIQPFGHPTDGKGTHVPDIEVQPLGDTRPGAVGLLPGNRTGLPGDLWAASSTDTIVALISRLDGGSLPAVQALYYTLLLAEADPPARDIEDARFLRARLAALRRFGAVDAALALVERAGPRTPDLFDDWLELSLLAGTETAPCAALTRRPGLSRSYGARIFCTARAGDWATAALTFDAARAVGTLDAREAALLSRFLDPEAAGVAGAPPPPRRMTPLLFRLYEAAGTPLPTRNLPREYAVADLRGTMGWKAEIEAAERLARTGALPANRLLGLYTERAPAASGGVWERVRAVQAVDEAMLSDDPARIAETLAPAWAMMHQSGLGVVFATLYGGRLAGRDIPAANDLARRIALLSPARERAIAADMAHTRRLRFLQGLATGAPDPELAETAMEQAAAAAFSAKEAPPDHAGPLSRGRLGQAILSAAIQLDGARPGRTGDVQPALATLRFVGMEDTARAAAMQLLLLDKAR